MLLIIKRIQNKYDQVIKQKILILQMDKNQGQIPANKLANFYYRLKKQYEQGKPITYQLDLASNQPKPRAAKFNIVITKFISIYKWGLRQSYDNEDDRRDNYWSQLNKHFYADYQMGFVNQIWQKPKSKLRKYFAILIHTKRIFYVLEKIVKQMGYLFIKEAQKIQNYTEDIKNLQFLADGQYKVMGDVITDYEEYADKRRQEQKIKQFQRLEKQRKQKQEEKKRKQKQQQMRKEQQQRQRKAREEQQKKIQVERKIKQQELAKKKEQQNALLITSDYFPTNYETAWKEKPNINKSASRKKLQLPNNRQHQGKLKNSEKLFIQRFKDEVNFFSYALQPQVNEADKATCFACKRNLKQGIYILGGNQNFCHYTGKWFCNDDISEQRKPIPWKAIKKFDLNGYSVCKVAAAQLNSNYEKPIIQITRDNPIVKQNKNLYDFLVVKKQMHLIYDSICNLEFIEPLMKKFENYCLKMNLLSMKNLYDIYHGQQTTRLQRDYQILSKHFYRCDICQKKHGHICPICKDPVKIFPFEIKQTFGCSNCRKLYHRKCVPTNQCRCKEDQ